MTFTVSDLIVVVNKEIDFHKETASRLQYESRDTSQFYRHQYLSQAMQEIKKILEKVLPEDEKIEKEPYFLNHESNDIVKNSDNLKDKVRKFIDKIDCLSGIDPFDENMPELSRIDALAIYIMSDGKQRNSTVIHKEIEKLIPNNTFEEKLVARRVYGLCDKSKLLEKQAMRGFFKIKSDLIQNI